jgi:uncharacterized DUF497 family protein
MDREFQWDATKERENVLKHGVSFEEASTVFKDPLMMTYSDVEHSRAEDRFITIGPQVLAICCW